MIDAVHHYDGTNEACARTRPRWPWSDRRGDRRSGGSETQALLNLLVDGIATARIVLLVNYRPEYHHQWGSKTYYSQLRLDPLGKESAQELLTALMGDDESILPLKRLIIERTEGNPFFMEETVQALFEQSVLARNGAPKLVKPINEIRVPPTVQAILASRIDRLPAAEKELLQTLAVLGREFSSGLIKRVAGKSDDELERMLSTREGFAEGSRFRSEALVGHALRAVGSRTPRS
jgi:predicted ATPase